MKQGLLLMIAVVSLGACTAGGSLIDSRLYEVALDEAHDDASIRCEGRVACDAMWQRTREFVMQRSATNIIRANQMTHLNPDRDDRISAVAQPRNQEIKAA
jgi:hypothetical protein